MPPIRLSHYPRADPHRALQLAAILQQVGCRVRAKWPPGARRGGSAGPAPDPDEIFTDSVALSERLPLQPDTASPPATIRGGRERGLVVHKLLGEVLTRETRNDTQSLEARAPALLAQLGTAEVDRPENGPYAPELAATALRALAIPEIAARRHRLVPELTVFSAQAAEDRILYTGGIADAVAYDTNGSIDLVVDWKTDVNPSAQQVALYREQISDYLLATGAPEGLLVFATTGQLVSVLSRSRSIGSSRSNSTARR